MERLHVNASDFCFSVSLVMFVLRSLFEAMIICVTTSSIFISLYEYTKTVDRVGGGRGHKPIRGMVGKRNVQRCPSVRIQFYGSSGSIFYKNIISIQFQHLCVILDVIVFTNPLYITNEYCCKLQNWLLLCFIVTSGCIIFNREIYCYTTIYCITGFGQQL